MKEKQKFSEKYIESRRAYYKDMEKSLPIFWKYIFAKRYILPHYRQADYVKQEACDYLGIDTFFGYLSEELQVKDHVSAHAMNNFVAALRYNRPTFYLERELGFPLMRTKLPLDYYASDLQWRFPAFRVYLPYNLLTITREGVPSSVMFLDICHVPKGEQNHIPMDLDRELERVIGPTKGQIPMLRSDYEGMSVSCVLDFDSPLSVVAYAASCMLEEQSIRQLIVESHKALDTPFKSDDLDVEFLNRLLALALNILLFLSSVPIEYESDKAIRKAKMEGKHLVTGLFPAKFIGQSQLRATSQPSHVASVPSSGKHLAAHWRAGHWKRQPYGAGRKERKLIWIVSYHAGHEEEPKN
jgi:hypothetical protein